MSPVHRTALRTRLATVTGLLCAALGPAAHAEGDPWELLARVRDRLADRPQLADFVQTYVPAGFTSGESESGTVAFDLPERLRWDYADPYPRSFLVSGSTVFAWSAGDAAGRRLDLASEEARHLDLLRLDTGTLSQRYVAELEAVAGGGGSEVLLTPVDPAAEIAEARLAVDADLRLKTLSYRDDEGNLTRFELSALRPLPDAGVLVAPQLEWQEP